MATFMLAQENTTPGKGVITVDEKANISTLLPTTGRCRVCNEDLVWATMIRAMTARRIKLCRNRNLQKVKTK